MSKVGKKDPVEKESFFKKSTNSKPLNLEPSVKETVVICLLTDSAAEEAGLQIGDVVLSVNGTEVTSAEHAEAVHLAKKGKWASDGLQGSPKMLSTQYTGSSSVRT